MAAVRRRTRKPDDRIVKRITRRAFLRSAKVFAGGATVLGAVGGLAAKAESPPLADDPTKRQGAPVRSYGERAPFETSARLPAPLPHPTASGSLTPLQDLHGIITPSALHFERHHAGVPAIDPARHRLLIHGLVERPLVLTMEDLRRFPSVSRIHFIECSGNTYEEWSGASGTSVQQTHGLTSCSEWTGVGLEHLLDEVACRPEAAWVVAEGGDGAAMTRSLPLEKCRDDVIVAYAQNGEMLRPEQGYPLRLVVPGWEGNVSVKWLRRLKLVDAPYQTREETAKYTDLMPDGTARQFTFVMEAKSVITTPSAGQTLAGRGHYEIRGLAWSGRGRITRVDVTTDDGASWRPADLQHPILEKCHTRFRVPWRWDGNECVIASRCADQTGYVQPTREALVAVRGAHSIYHNNAIQRWRIDPHGIVRNA
jgi:sulfane dehydrogenase subunit SoxC